MNKTIKIEKEKVIVLGDLHLGHAKDFIFRKRGFAKIEDHDSFILSDLKKYTLENPSVTIINLGDACLTQNQRRNFDTLSLFPCSAHYFVWGNHNAGATEAYEQSIYDNYRIAKKGIEVYPSRYNQITFVGNELNLILGSQPVFCSHFAHAVWDGMQFSAWHLCGHSHGSFAEINEGENGVGKIFDCGVENAIRLTGHCFFTFDQIEQIMSKKQIVKKDHHEPTAATVTKKQAYKL